MKRSILPTAVSRIIRAPDRTSRGLVAGLVITGLALAACTPTVKVATDDPITINLNVNIKHEILVKVDKDLEDVFSKDSGLF